MEYEDRIILELIEGRTKGDAMIKKFGMCMTTDGPVPTMLLVDVVLCIGERWIKVDHAWVRFSKVVLPYCLALTSRSRISFTVSTTKYKTGIKQDIEQMGIRKIRDIQTLHAGKGLTLHEYLKHDERKWADHVKAFIA